MSLFDHFRPKPEKKGGPPEQGSDAPEASHDVPPPVEGLEMFELRSQYQQSLGEIARLEAQIQRTRVESEEATLGEVAKLIASPISHLAQQATLAADVGESSLSLADLAETADRLLQALSIAGITLLHHVGDAVKFEPSRHLDALGTGLLAGQDAVVVTPGVAVVSGRVIKKAGVQSQ